MAHVVREESLATPLQLLKATLASASTASNPWASDPNATASPTRGILVQADYGNAAGSYVEVGGPSITPGNGIQLAPGDTDFVNAPTAAQVWAVPSTGGLQLRGQVR